MIRYIPGNAKFFRNACANYPQHFVASAKNRPYTTERPVRFFAVKIVLQLFEVLMAKGNNHIPRKRKTQNRVLKQLRWDNLCKRIALKSILRDVIPLNHHL